MLNIFGKMYDLDIKLDSCEKMEVEGKMCGPVVIYSEIDHPNVVASKSDAIHGMAIEKSDKLVVYLPIRT